MNKIPETTLPGLTKLSLLTLLLITTATTLQAQRSRSGRPAGVDRAGAQATRLADEYMAEFKARFPEQADLNGLTVARHDGLTDNSQRALRSWQALEDGWARRLARLDPAALEGRPEWVTLGFLKEAIESSRQIRVCRYELWPANQLSGWQSWMSQLADVQPVGTETARSEALARWGQVPRYLDTEIENLREGARLGYTTPRPNVRLVIEQLDQILAKPVEQWSLYSPAERDTSEQFKQAWAKLLSTRIKPAIERYRDYLRDDYLKAARERIAITAIPQGAACYQASFRAYTTLNRRGAETFEIGRRRVERNRREALEIARTRLGINDLKTLVDRIHTDPANKFTSREQLLTFATDAVERARRSLPDWFTRVPRARITVEPYPDFIERAASDSYWPSAQDGSRSAMYRITLYRFAETTRSNAEITAFHESYPGHHLQISLALEQPAAHPITRLIGNSGFIEGWARYAETLSEEIGLYSSDYARANRRLWPSRGMVVDPGIHLFGWSREQAVAFILESGRMGPQEAAAAVDRIAVWPAQMTAYDTGALEFFAMRDRARQTLGPRFNIREFHDVVLGSGALTLPMLREKVRRWLRDRSMTNNRTRSAAANR
ncbi:MAG TPA: DUF885 domain-containing protein [Pyrinomonadaceae bacterium]|jgi:uncharacterized protein (DUF885 family)|nr:DUF885 domain-containing protein [Pyrinomonadaceae bacterium]